MRTFESLTVPNYRLLWLGQLSSSMGQWMDQVSRSWLIYVLTQSPLELGLVSAVRGVPFIIFGGFAGAVADRYGHRKLQLIIAQVVNAFINLVLALLVLTGNVHPWHVYVTGFLAGTVQAFQQPARQVLINDVVGRKHLLNAISLNSAALNLSRSVGPALCGVLIQFWGVDTSYFIQAGIFALATVWTVQIKVQDGAPAVTSSRGTEIKSLLGSTREGMSYIFSNKLMLSLIVLGLAPTALGMPFVALMPIFAIDIFHGGATTQGILLAMLGVGAVVGALVMASLGRAQTSGKLLVAGAAAFGVTLMFFSWSPVIVMAASFSLLAGFFNSSYMSQNQTIVQLMAPPELRGRVLGILLLNRGMMPVGSLLAGVLATLLGAQWAVMVMGICCFLLAISMGFFVPSLWKLSFNPEA